jgi:hypothetical protein
MLRRFLLLTFGVMIVLISLSAFLSCAFSPKTSNAGASLIFLIFSYKPYISYILLLMGSAHPTSLIFLIFSCLWAVPILQNFVYFALSLIAGVITIPLTAV